MDTGKCLIEDNLVSNNFEPLSAGRIDRPIVSKGERYRGLSRSMMTFGLWTVFCLFSVFSALAQGPIDMAQVRDGASTLLLPDGRVLIAGGSGVDGAVASVEIFTDTATFITGAPMNVARTQYAAVVLADGRVLVTGGLTTGGEPTNTAEIYDPSADVWHLLGNMGQARFGHTASLLSQRQDGKVLIAGGDASAGAAGSLEIFDPFINTFAPAGYLSSARRNHSAAVLNDDRVLIVGGEDEVAALATIDVYDPTMGTVTAGPALASARNHASATLLLDGKVLIAGGQNETGDLATAEIYDPASNMLALAGSNFITARSSHVALLLPNNNNVLFVGGISNGTSLDSCELYVPWTDQFMPASPLIDARVHAAGTPLGVNGLLLVAGGSGLNTAEVLDFHTLRTDKDDYPPFSFVDITGTGYLPDEPIYNQVTQVEGPDAGAVYDAWMAQADSAGDFFTTWLVFSDELLNTTLELTATGTTSSLSARTRFTDGNVKVDIDPNVSAHIDILSYSAPNCTGTFTDESFTGTSKSVGGNASSVHLEASLFNTLGSAFINWTGPRGFINSSSTICVPVPNTGNDTYTAHYSTNVATNLALAVTPNTVTYGNSGPVSFSATLTRSSNSNAVQGATISFKVDGSTVGTAVTNSSGIATFSTYNPQLLNASTHNIDATFAGQTLVGTTYAASNSNTQSLTITPRPITITADARSKTYGNADPAFTYQITAGSLRPGDSFTGSLSRNPGESIGTYAITQGTVALTSNYTLTYVPADLTITTRPVTITADAKAKTYGDGDPALTYQITAGTLAFSDALTGSLTRDPGEDVGTYAITQGTVALTSNYALTYVPADLTISTRPVTITADAKSKTYGDADPTLTYQITAGTVAFTDAFTGSLTRDPGEDVGTYAITPGTVALTSNYALTYVPADLTISTRPITITADARAKIYGDADPALTYQITAGTLAFSDAFTGSLSRDPGEDVGTYAITQGTVALTGNYALTYVPADLTINVRSITITADAKSKTYGDADPALTYQITAGTLAFSDAFTGNLTRDPGEDVGTYAITQGTVALTSNYALTYVSADLTINVRPITITADAKSKIYGDADPALTYQITAGTLAFSDAFTGSLTRDPGEDVGTYAITQGTVTLTSNYALTYVPADLTISTRPVKITADAKSKTYGDSDPALTYQITDGSLAFTDAFTGSLTRDPGEDVGVYAITQGTVALTSNYALTYVPADLTINVRPITITADAKSKTYGDADPALTYQITAGTLAFSDAFMGSLTRDAGEDVGTYAITQGTVALTSNYSLTYVPADLTIGTRPVTITADAKSKIYGDVDPVLTYQITAGTLAFSDTFTGSLSRDPGEEVGTYAITQGTVALTGNYALTYVPADLTINVRPVTITADAKSKTYGDADLALTYQITAGSLAVSDVFTGSLTRDSGEDVGTYAITQGTVALTSNYALTYVPADLTISTRPVTITADAKSKIYGDADPALTYQITAGTLAFSDSFSGSLTRDPGEDVGTYAITQGTVALTSNYALTYVSADLTISTRPVTITADAKSKTYGDADPALTYQITAGTLAFSDSFSGSLTRDSGEDVGTYAITQGTVALTSNYALTYVPADLTITTRPVTITADAKAKTYGDTDPALTYQITAGTLAFSDAFTGTLTRDTGEDVGTYAITPGTVALTSNYALTYVPADLTISTRPVTITADAKSKIYGDADPALTYQITAGTLAFSDALTGSLTRDPGEDVGTYAITQGIVALTSNYALTYVPADLTISTRPVTITADAKSKTYGDADPTLTYQITAGTVAFTDAFTGSLTRDPGEDVGTYAITPGTVALTSNYALTYVPADLTISTRPITITADARAKIYGDADPALTYQITAGTLAFSDAFTGSLSRDPGEDVGTYAITQGTVALTGNYALTYVPADLTINVRSITITADAKSKTYGDADPALTYQITAGTLAFSDAFTGNLTRDPGEDVGTYAITQGTVALTSNYTLTYLNSNLSISPATLTVTANPQTKVYGNSDPALTYIATGLRFSDTQSAVLSGALTRAPGEDVASSPYAITQGTLAANSNYTLAFVGNNLSVTRRPITVTADAKTKSFGAPDPALTYNITVGTLAFTDSFTGALTRVVGELVGTYPIQQGTLALGNNYTLTFVGANLTITSCFTFIGFQSPIGGAVELGNGGTFAQPVRSFKLGSTIPVKFTLSNCAGQPMSTGIHKLAAIKYDNAASSQPAIDATPTDSATTGNEFRLTSAGGGEWHYNLSTKQAGLSQGTWLLVATLSDGSKYSVWIDIKK